MNQRRKKNWENHLVPMINKKFSTLKGNATQNMRRLFMGKGNKCNDFIYSHHKKANINNIDLFNYLTQRIQERLTIHLLMRWVRFIGEEQMINKILSSTMSDLCIAMHRLLWEHDDYIHTSSPIPETLFLMHWTQVTRHLRVWF